MTARLRRIRRTRMTNRRQTAAGAATVHAGFFSLIAIIAVLSVEYPLLGLFGWPAIVFLAVVAFFCVAAVFLIPLAYAVY